MAYRSRERQKEAEHRWYLKNKDKVLDKKRRKKERLREVIRTAKDRPCSDCGVVYPYYVMDFDHVDGTKEMVVSQIAARGAARKLALEMAKCEVVCSNCHRIRTWTRMQDESLRTVEVTTPAPIEAQLQLVLDGC